MAGNTIGKIFQVTTWGESHGPAVGVIVDGCPPQIKINEKIIQKDLDRRKPGQSSLTSQRNESDQVKILSGLFEGKTLGTPIALLVMNKDSKSTDYESIKDIYRPGHADLTYEQKYGIRDWQGGGRASARETVGRVAAGAIAKQILKKVSKTEILTFVQKVGDIEAQTDPDKVTRAQIERNLIRCPVQTTAQKMEQLILGVKKKGDSIGGVIECIIRNCPAGLGEPVFDKLDADLAKACLSIPATKGFEIGAGFSCTQMKGSQYNDSFYLQKGQIRTRTNHAGGVLGGISSGENIVIRVAFKPTPSISKSQQTVTSSKKETNIELAGRHDPCVLPRAVAVVEAMVAIVIADHLLRSKTHSS